MKVRQNYYFNSSFMNIPRHNGRIGSELLNFGNMCCLGLRAAQSLYVGIKVSFLFDFDFSFTRDTDAQRTRPKEKFQILSISLGENDLKTKSVIRPKSKPSMASIQTASFISPNKAI